MTSAAAQGPTETMHSSLPSLSASPAGLLRSVSVVTSDACLYGEYFSIQLAQRKVAESQRDRVRLCGRSSLFPTPSPCCCFLSTSC